MKLSKRLLVTLLAVLMVLSICPIVALPAMAAVRDDDVAGIKAEVTGLTGTWREVAATAFAGGAGSAEDPYQIATAEQLAYMGVMVEADNRSYSEAKYILTADIDLAGRLWIPIGNAKINNNSSGNYSGFGGTLDGNGHAIYNMMVTTTTPNSGSYPLGLIGYAQGATTIKNLALIDAVVYSQTYVTPGQWSELHSGSFVGTHSTAPWNGNNTMTLENLYTNATLITDGASNDNNVTTSWDWRLANDMGGIFGASSVDFSVKNCVFNGALFGSTNGAVSAFANKPNRSDGGKTHTISDVVLAPNGGQTAKDADYYTGYTGTQVAAMTATNSYAYESVTASKLTGLNVSNYAGLKALAAGNFTDGSVWSFEGELPVPAVIADKCATLAKIDPVVTTIDIATTAEFKEKFGKTEGSEMAPVVYRLTADLDFTGEEWSVLNLKNATFDGQGHKISGIYKKTGTGQWQYASFLYELKNATVKNLVMDDITIEVDLTNTYRHNYGEVAVNVFSNVVSGQNYMENVFIDATVLGTSFTSFFGNYFSGGIDFKDVQVSGTMDTYDAQRQTGVVFANMSNDGLSSKYTNFLSTVAFYGKITGDASLLVPNGNSRFDTASSNLYALNLGVCGDSGAPALGYKNVGEGMTGTLLSQAELLGEAAKESMPTMGWYDAATNAEGRWVTTAAGYPMLKIAADAEAVSTTPITAEEFVAAAPEAVQGAYASATNADTLKNFAETAQSSILGAQIHYDSSKTGAEAFTAIRFGAQIKLDTTGFLYNTVFSGNTMNGQKALVKAGMLIIPQQVLGENELVASNTDALDIEANNLISTEADGITFACRVTGMTSEVYGVDMVARAYIAYSTDGGETFTYVYTDAVVRSMASIAATLYTKLDDGDAKTALAEAFGLGA